MTGKRGLVQDEPASGKADRDRAGMKRRKILHDEVESPTRSKKKGGKDRKSKIEDSDAASIKSPKGSGLSVGKSPSKVSEELFREENAQDQQLVEVQPKSSADWTISRCRSGRFLNLDPVFTADGQNVILATEDSVQVFSMSTSRVVRTLPTSDEQSLSGYKLSPSNAEHLFVSSHAGAIVQWNWESGTEIRTLKKPNPVFAIDLAAVGNDLSSDHDQILFALCQRDDGHSEISANVLPEGADDWESAVVLERSTSLSDMRVVAGGKVILAWAGDRLLVGNSTSSLSSSLESVKYTWREVRLPVRVTCLDARVTLPTDERSHKTAAPSSESVRVDIALGETAGSILVYNDLLNRLMRSENNEAENNLISSRLHWHRKAVKAVKWSKDGNYIISGGLETVLVLWQLDTGRKQFLPHLSAPICNLVVSPKGTSYAIKLGDNSAMVLSTSELRPVASMSGLQLPRREDILSRPVEMKGNKSKSSTGDIQLSDRLPAVLHPVQPDHLLLAVPSTQLLSSMDVSPTASLLQAFDFRSGQHISRQALTRTNVSVLNTGPQGTELTTPDIQFIKISSDGDWLATVDEWNQYPADNNVLRPDTELGSCGKNRELFLKFWHWEESVREWQLVTRIDAPHFSPSKGGSFPVLDLAVRSEELGFATVGGDGVVRLWSPDTRHPVGRKRDDARRRPVRSWQCSQTVVLEKQTKASQSQSASLGFSNDGSILAVCWPASVQGGVNLVRLIDPLNGNIRCSRDGLFQGTPMGMGFLDRFLIILSNRLVIWDIVSDEVKFMLRLNGKGSNSLLAVNPRNQTFAVAFNTDTDVKRKESSHFQLAVFEPKSPQPVFQLGLKNPPRALLPDLRSGEYVVVDTTAQIMRVGSGDRAQPLSIDDGPSIAVQTGLGNIFGSYTTDPGLARTGAIESNERTDEVLGSKSLTDIFDVAPSFALPAVDVLFKNVVDLFNGGTAKA